jgi:8-oxo-dGTP pyrophosphatase MutT (NUDIX family)
MSSRIDVTVAAVIERDERFLVVEELVGGKRVFNQPAGHLETGETLQAAAIREVLEETGHKFIPRALLGLILWQLDDRSFLRVTFVGEAESPSGECRLDEGIIATHWLTRGELVQRRSRLRSPMVLSCIDRYLAGERYPLHVVRDLLPDLETVANIA